MPKSLNDILKGVKKSTITPLTTGNNPGVDYADKMKDSRDFLDQHSVEKHADRVSNEDDVYQASKVKKAVMARHGHEPKPKDINVYNKTNQVTEAKDPKEYGYEGDMAVTQLKTICRNAEHLMKMMKPDTDLPEWVQSKITKAEDYISTAHDYLMSEMKEETELSEAKCNMSEAGTMCEVHGKKACPKEDDESAQNKEPRYNGEKDKSGKKQLITDKKLQEMSTSQNQAIAARIALKHKREKTMPPKGTASSSMMSMSQKQLKDYTKAEPGAPKKVHEGFLDQRSKKSTNSEEARKKISSEISKRKEKAEDVEIKRKEKLFDSDLRKQEIIFSHKLKNGKGKIKEQSAPAETSITFPATNSREGLKV